MSTGRPKGSKNSRHHNAGGSRKGAGRRSTLSKAASAPGQQRLHLFGAAANAAPAAAASDAAERAARAAFRSQRRKIAEDEARKSLRAAAERAENPLDLNADDADSADEYNSEAEQQEGAAAAAKPKRKSRHVMPAEGSPAAVRLNEIQSLRAGGCEVRVSRHL